MAGGGAAPRPDAPDVGVGGGGWSICCVPFESGAEAAKMLEGADPRNQCVKIIGEGRNI